MFSAHEVLDIIDDYVIEHGMCPCDGWDELENDFLNRAEERSRLPELQETWVKHG
jgi:hypothetical protein